MDSCTQTAARVALHLFGVHPASTAVGHAASAGRPLRQEAFSLPQVQYSMEPSQWGHLNSTRSPESLRPGWSSLEEQRTGLRSGFFLASY